MTNMIISALEVRRFFMDLEFYEFGYNQHIGEIVFDTGCTHSLISASSLSTLYLSEQLFKEGLLYDINTRLNVTKGIEVDISKLNEIRSVVSEVNRIKNYLQNKNLSADEVEEEMHNRLGADKEAKIFESKNVRYEHLVKDLKINNINIGDCKIHIAFNIEEQNLIGMEIIQQLVTKICTRDDTVYLFAKKLVDLNTEAELEKDIQEYFKLLDDQQVLEANSLKRQIDANPMFKLNLEE